MRIPGLVAVLALAACLPSRDRPAAVEAWVVHTSHAPTIDAPWWWRGASPPDAATCREIAEGRVGELGGDQVTVAAVVIDRDALRLGDATVLALRDGVVPARAREGQRVAPLAAAMAAALERHSAYLAACGRTGDPIDVLLAAAPDTPQHTILAVMYTLIHAGVERTFLAVAGGAERRWTPGFTVDEEQLVLTLAGETWRAGVDLDRRRDVPIADLSAVPELLQGRPLGCAAVPLRLAAPWSRAVAEMDVLAGLGAHQFTLDARETGAPAARTPGAPGERIDVRVGGTVAALANISPRISGVDRGSSDHVRAMSPCVGLTALRAAPPTPEELERMHEAFDRTRDDGDVWAPLLDPKQ